MQAYGHRHKTYSYAGAGIRASWGEFIGQKQVFSPKDFSSNPSQTPTAVNHAILFSLLGACLGEAVYLYTDNAYPSDPVWVTTVMGM